MEFSSPALAIELSAEQFGRLSALAESKQSSLEQIVQRALQAYLEDAEIEDEARSLMREMNDSLHRSLSSIRETRAHIQHELAIMDQRDEARNAEAA